MNATTTSKLQLFFDIVIVLGSLYFLLVFNGVGDLTMYHTLIVLVPVLMWFSYPNFIVSMGYAAHTKSILWAWIKVAVTLSILAFITKTSEEYSRLVMISWFITAAILQTLAHAAMSYLIRRYQTNNQEITPCIIVGNSQMGQHILEHINQNTWMSQKIVGMVSDDGYPDHLVDTQKLGGLDKLYHLVKKHHVKQVYFAIPMTTGNQIRKLQMQLIDLNIDIIWVPDIFGLQISPPSIHEISGVPLYYLSERPQSKELRINKWLMDKVFSIIALSMLAPFMLIIALAVKLSSPGPVFFHQERHGLNNKVFKMIKFRSMRHHTEKAGKITQASRNDPRVTTIGRFLRASSMDELPQIFNVLKGDMSLVGPRPHAKEHNDFYTDQIEGYMSRHNVRPGITGLAQVSGYRGETETLEKMIRRLEYDLAYINNWSIGLDVKIMFKTIHTLFSDYGY